MATALRRGAGADGLIACRHTPVDDDIGAGEIGPVIGRQEEGRAGDVVGVGRSVEGGLGDALLH